MLLFLENIETRVCLRLIKMKAHIIAPPMSTRMNVTNAGGAPPSVVRYCTLVPEKPQSDPPSSVNITPAIKTLPHLFGSASAFGAPFLCFCPIDIFLDSYSRIILNQPYLYAWVLGRSDSKRLC